MQVFRQWLVKEWIELIIFYSSGDRFCWGLNIYLFVIKFKWMKISKNEKNEKMEIWKSKFLSIRGKLLSRNEFRKFCSSFYHSNIQRKNLLQLLVTQSLRTLSLINNVHRKPHMSTIWFYLSCTAIFSKKSAKDLSNF